jgi:two-component system, OmpR family, KDP operon response regulator KdpE
VAGTRLLLVEDNPQIVRAVLPALEVSGHAVTVASDGASALILVAASEWDALIVDLGLPDMDGKDVVRYLRERSGTPVIVISARDSARDQMDCCKAGASHFLRKPFATSELLACLSSAVEGPTASR